MEYRFLGATGMKVSEFCLGAMTFGREATEEDSRSMMDRFVDAGGNFIDTANVYSTGGSEEIVGRWLAGKDRHSLVLATKVRFPMGKGPNDTGVSRKVIRAHVEDSLRRLQTDFIDLYQVHCWDRGTELEETLSTLDRLVQEGKVRYIGASNYTGWQLQKALDTQRARGWEPFRCLQPQYNLLTRQTEWEMIPVCRNEGLGVIPWGPLKGGWLSGKYYRGMDGPPTGSRVEEAEKRGWWESWKNMNKESTWRTLDALHEVAKETGKSPAQVALRWLLQRPGVTAPIIGVRTMKHLDDELGALEWSLGDEHMEKLTTASDPELPYPWNFVEFAQGGRAH
ncbi:MAG: aldo/keto reductase [Spirochaetes bacterium]|jgi:aryl-alcohol dehydrogenase-like predicted oxidoreductase|nr:aldo/keto reductase [Spirochaetota bacterium]